MNQVNSPQISPGPSKEENSTQNIVIQKLNPTESNSQFIIQNGNVYKLAGTAINTAGNKVVNSTHVLNNPQKPSLTASNLANLSGTKNVILNTLPQGNLSQRLKMSTIKSGTVLNLNTSKVVYKTVQRNGFITSSNPTKQIIIQGNTGNSRLTSLINNTTNSNKSVIVLNSQNQSAQGPNTVQYIIQKPQQQQNEQNQSNTPTIMLQNVNNNTNCKQPQQQQQHQQMPNSRSTVYLSTNSPLLNNLKSSNAPPPATSTTSLATNKIQNILENKSTLTLANQTNDKQSVQQLRTQHHQLNPANSDLNNLDASIIGSNSIQTMTNNEPSNKNVIFVMNNNIQQQQQHQQQQQIIKFNKPTSTLTQVPNSNNMQTIQSIPPPPVATNSILRAHLSLEPLNTQPINEQQPTSDSIDVNSQFMMQSNGLNIEQSQNYSTISADTSNIQMSKLKNKEIVKITPVATKNSSMRLSQSQITNSANNGGNNNCSQPAFNKLSANNPINLLSPAQNNHQNDTNIDNNQLASQQQIHSKIVKNQSKVLKENQNFEQATDKNACNELFSGLDDKFFPSDEILNELLLPDTRIFASLLNKDLSSTKQNTNNLSNNSNPGNKKTYADLTYKTVMIGNTEHIILDNFNNLSDYRGDFAKLQTLACAVANKFNKPVTIPSFLLLKDDSVVQNVKKELIGNNINPLIIENLECNDNTSNVPNRLLKDNSLFQQTTSTACNSQTKDESNSNNNKTYHKAATPNPMSSNSQNHYLIQSLQSESKHNQQLKENQPIQTAPQDPQQTVQRFYTESPITNQDNTQPAIPSNSDKKNAKARKSIVPKNPNTPKRRKTTICSKEKVNQIPLNSQPSGSQSEYLPDGMAIATNSLPTVNCVNNEPLAKKQRKIRNSISSMQTISSPAQQMQPVTTQVQQVPMNYNIQQQQQQIIDLQSMEANTINQQNIQIQNIANDLLRVKDDMQSSQQNTQMNLVNTNNISFINETIQQVTPLSGQPTNNINNELVNVQFMNDDFSLIENKVNIDTNNKQIVQNISDSLVNSNSSNNNGHVYINNIIETVENNQTNMAQTTEAINDYDFNFDAFDSNVLFNFNDMEFI